jgi:hypothetical protein
VLFFFSYIIVNMENLSINTNFSGAIDYMVYKYNNKYIVLLLDNHNPESYCSDKTKFSGIERLFEHYIKKDTMFVFEELDGIKPSDQFKELFSKTPHLTKYMEFYSKYKHDRNKIKPIDIRILFDNFHKSDGLDLLDQFFGLTPCIDPDVQPIAAVISNAVNQYEVFATHYRYLCARYIELKKVLTTPIKCDGSSFLEEIILTYPFEQENLNVSVCEGAELLLSGLLEIYTIANILLSNNKYIFVYLGAAHCISICGLFDRYYKIRKVKDLSYLKITGSRFNLGSLDSHTKSCVNFNPGFVEK